MSYQPPASIQIQSTANAASAGVKMLVYGRAGAGKTRLSATAPNPLILSAESGILSLRQFNLPFIQISNLGELDAALNFVRSPQANEFLTICLDSVSEIAEICLAAELRDNKDPRKAYGEMANQMMQILRAFRDLPQRNVLFTAKQGRVTDQQTGGLLWGPLMPGQQLDQQLPYMFDEVFQLVVGRDQTGNVFRAIRTQPDHQNEAKDRSGALDAWEPPDIGHIIQKIQRG